MTASSESALLAPHRAHIRALRGIGRSFHAKNWSLGTSSNYSVVVERTPLRLLITASGKDKGRLRRHDFVLVDAAGKAIDATLPKPSAETLLHAVLAKNREVGAVLHTHSVWSTVLSDRYFSQGRISWQGYEMLKGLEGIATHEAAFHLEILENTQDMPALSGILEARLQDGHSPLLHGFLLRRHGLYTWGRSLNEARRHVEILEFLLEVKARELALATEV